MPIYGIKCPHCGVAVKGCIDSRASGDTIRRRRECHKCGTRFSTVEVFASMDLHGKTFKAAVEVQNRRPG